MQKTFTHPKKSDLSLEAKELLKIEIYFSSFKVYSQNIMVLNCTTALEVNESIFPLSALSKFFKINSELELGTTRRSNSCQWSPSFDASIWLEPGSQNLSSKTDTEG